MTNALGYDIAQCNGAINGTAILSHYPDPVYFIGIRASISWAYPTMSPYLDRWEWFKRVWPMFETIGRMPYHVLYPAEDGKAQMANHLKVVPARTPHIRRVIDAELDHGQTRKTITDKCEYLVKTMQDADGLPPVVYSRKSWIEEHMEYRPWWDEVDWWLAQYLDRYHEDTRPLALPKGITQWLIHQTGDKCAPVGVESLEMDYNRWNGDAASVRAYFGFCRVPRPNLFRHRITSSLRSSFPDTPNSGDERLHTNRGRENLPASCVSVETLACQAR